MKFKIESAKINWKIQERKTYILSNDVSHFGIALDHCKHLYQFIKKFFSAVQRCRFFKLILSKRKSETFSLVERIVSNCVVFDYYSIVANPLPLLLFLASILYSFFVVFWRVFAGLFLFSIKLMIICCFSHNLYAFVYLLLQERVNIFLFLSFLFNLSNDATSSMSVRVAFLCDSSTLRVVSPLKRKWKEKLKSNKIDEKKTVFLIWAWFLDVMLMMSK